MIELSQVFTQPGAVTDWANRVSFNTELSQEDKEVNEAMDAWARELGKTGDPNHELSALITRSFPNAEVTFPTELLDRFFDNAAIGEFDDYEAEFDPKNTMVAHEAIIEGNVDRAFVEHNVGKAQWHSLAAETDVSMQDLRRGGYRTVANLINYMREAMELKRVRMTMNFIDNLITTGDNYITEATTLPTVASMDKLELYLHDVTDGETPLAFTTSKYHQAITKLPQANYMYLMTEAQKNMYYSTGRIDKYAGMDLLSYSGQKKLADGALIVPDKRIFGVAGKIGNAITRGETRTFQESNINTERIHIKLNGYTFGFCVNPDALVKIAKIVLA